MEEVSQAKEEVKKEEPPVNGEISKAVKQVNKEAKIAEIVNMNEVKGVDNEYFCWRICRSDPLR